MLLSSVILVLQDTLEAALLISVLLAISFQRWDKVTWLLFGISGGLFFSFLYASYMAEISEWFDYTGQEIVNASLQVFSTLFIVICVWALFKSRQYDVQLEQSQKNRFSKVWEHNILYVLIPGDTICCGVSRFWKSFFYKNGRVKNVDVVNIYGLKENTTIDVLVKSCGMAK